MQWSVGGSTFKALPENGARLMHWGLKLANGTMRDIIYWPEDADYSNLAKVRGGNPLLFPFVARTFDQGVEGYWRFQGKRLPMPRHGFARDAKFELIHSDEQGFTSRLAPPTSSFDAYPFKYQFLVRYHFEELSFSVDLSLENQDEVPIPWCAGHHFYFKLPWHSGLTREDYTIHIPAKKAFYHGANGALEPAKDIAVDETFSNLAIVDRIHCKLKDNVIVFGPNSGEEPVSVVIGDDKIPAPWTCLTTWTESDESPFYCVEPWMGPPGSPEHKKGLQWVDPNETKTFSVTVSLA